MSENVPGKDKHDSGKSKGISLGKRLRAYFFAGMLVTAPISITIYLAYLFINFVDGKVGKLIPAPYHPETYLPFGLPGIGLVIIIVGLTLIGSFTAGFMGKMVVKTSENLLQRMPVIRTIYGAIKQILETVLAQQSQAFREAVLVEYPRRGLWAIAFITGRTEGEVQNLTEEECTNIFLPTTPNPTSGFLLFVPKRDLIPLSMTVEEAIKMVISGGIVTPPDHRPEEEQKIPRVSAKIYEDIDVMREKENRPVSVVSSRYTGRYPRGGRRRHPAVAGTAGDRDRWALISSSPRCSSSWRRGPASSTPWPSAWGAGVWPASPRLSAVPSGSCRTWRRRSSAWRPSCMPAPCCSRW